jgi:hypothetical protein
LTNGLSAKLESFFEMMGQGDEFAQHGFDLLIKRGEPEKYFDALKERGFFDPAKNSGPVPSTNPGFVHIPIWHAVTYLDAVAKRAAAANDDALSQKILQVIRDVSSFRDSKNGEPTDNYQTYFRFADIWGILPVRCIELDDLRLIRTWLKSKYDRGMIAYSLAKGLLKNLLASGTPDDIKKACVIVEECMAFEWSSEERRGRTKELVTLVDDYWLKEMLNKYARELGEKAGLDAVSIFEKGLRTIFSDERRSYGSTLWRPAIETSGQNLDWHGAENRFVEGMRDALQGWIDAKPDAATVYVAQALQNKSEIIRRIALHSVTEHFELLREAFENVIAPELFTSSQRHELYRLLNQRFGELSDAGKAAIIDAIRKLPPPATGEDPARRLKFIQREWLSGIKNHPEAAAWFSQLSSDPELGSVSDYPDFLAYHEIRSGPGPAPFGADSLTAFAEDGTLVDRLNGFTETDSWKGPTLGGLVAALEGAVAANPETFLPLLETFHGAKVAFQHALIQGFKRVFDPSNDKKPDFDWNSAWPKLMAFFTKCVGAPQLWEPDEEQNRMDLVPTTGWMRTLIASILEAGTRDDKTAYPPELLPQGWAIIKTLLDRAPESELSLCDPMTHALNTEKGHAVGAMYNHALRVCRLENAVSKSTEAAWASLKGAFDAEIAKCGDANYDFSTLSASYIANLDFMSHEWLAKNVVALFPAAAYPNNFKVAICGLAYGTPTRRLYQLLASKGIFADALAVRLEDRHGRERLVEWISLAYLWDDEELDTPILQQVFSGGADDLETMANFFWSARGDKLTDKQKAKIFAFWDRCLVWSRSQPKMPQQLLARLGRLAAYVETLDQQARERLLGTVPYVHNDYATDAMVEELARLVDTNAPATAEILERMLEASAPTYDLDDKLKSLIERLAELGQRDAAIRCADRVRRTLPGMLALYKKLAVAN